MWWKSIAVAIGLTLAGTARAQAPAPTDWWLRLSLSLGTERKWACPNCTVGWANGLGLGAAATTDVAAGVRVGIAATGWAEILFENPRQSLTTVGPEIEWIPRRLGGAEFFACPALVRVARTGTIAKEYTMRGFGLRAGIDYRPPTRHRRVFTPFAAVVVMPRRRVAAVDTVWTGASVPVTYLEIGGSLVIR